MGPTEWAAARRYNFCNVVPDDLMYGYSVRADPTGRWMILASPPSHTMFRFHLPLIKPDVQVSHTRLSDKDSCFRPRNVAVAQEELDKI